MGTSIVISQSISPSNLSRLFAQIMASDSVTATSEEKTIIGAGVGSLEVPANVFSIGNSFHLDLSGQVTAANNETLEIRVKAGSILLADTGIITMSGATNSSWEMEVDFTIRALGTAGNASIVSSGQFIYNKDAANSFEGEGFNVTNNTTFDTTISNTLDITVQWGSNSASNSIHSDLCVLYRTF